MSDDSVTVMMGVIALGLIPLGSWLMGVDLEFAFGLEFVVVGVAILLKISEQ